MTADDRRPVPPPVHPDPHPDLDALADLHAGALDDPAAARVRAHVSSCPRCSQLVAALDTALDTVRGELHGLPTPAVPAAVAARLDATVADLRRGDLRAAGPSGPGSAAASGGGAGARSPEPVADLGAARQRRRRRLARGLGSVAAAVAVIAAGASVIALVRTGGSDNSSTAASTAAGTAGADSAAGVDKGAGAPEAAPGRTQSPGTALAVPSYDRETLRAALPSIARESALSIVTGRGDTGPAGAMADTARRTACAGTIRGSQGPPQAVLRIRYEGRLAYVFVFDGDGDRVAYVVSDDCGTSPALPASVLDTVP
jgi:hypothetical protein